MKRTILQKYTANPRLLQVNNDDTPSAGGGTDPHEGPLHQAGHLYRAVGDAAEVTDGVEMWTGDEIDALSRAIDDGSQEGLRLIYRDTPDIRRLTSGTYEPTVREMVMASLEEEATYPKGELRPVTLMKSRLLED
eukprot:SAG31_NODE_9016_length_1347_cov_2.705128_1_plen_134_part_10